METGGKPGQQARGMFENALQLRRRRRRKRDVHNASAVVAATLLVIREVSCGRTLEKRASLALSENILFGGKNPKTRARTLRSKGQRFSQRYIPLQSNKLWLLLLKKHSSHPKCGPPRHWSVVTHLNPTGRAASQHRPFRVLPFPTGTSIKNSPDREWLTVKSDVWM